MLHYIKFTCRTSQWIANSSRLKHKKLTHLSNTNIFFGTPAFLVHNIVYKAKRSVKKSIGPVLLKNYLKLVLCNISFLLLKLEL